MGMEVKVPKITVSADAHQKMQHWIKLAPGEISGLGIVEEIEGGYHVPEVFLLDQECTGSDTEIDPMAIAKLQMELMQKEDGLQDKLKFWWHSHVNMAVFWSGTDEECIRQIRGNRYLLSIVYNKKNEYRARLDYANNHTILTIDKMDMSLTPPNSDELFDAVFDELTEDHKDGGNSVYEFSKELFDELKKRNLITSGHFDLGWEDFCKKEYEAKVKNKYGTGNYWAGQKKHGGHQRGPKKNGGGGGYGNHHQQHIPFHDPCGSGRVHPRMGLVRGLDDEFFDPEEIFQLEENIDDVVDFMAQTFVSQENWVE